MTRILPHVVGCPDVTAKEALLDTAIEFCEKTLIIRQTLDPLDTESDVLEYELFAPTNQEIVYPIQVWFKGQLLQPVAADLIKNVQAYATETISDFVPIKGAPAQYFWLSAGVLGLFPIPNKSELGAITVRAALKPTRTATQLDDVLFNSWADALVAGTLARLHMMKDQPWASADRALMRAREFRISIQRARVEASIGRVRTSLSVCMRGF